MSFALIRKIFFGKKRTPPEGEVVRKEKDKSQKKKKKKKLKKTDIEFHAGPDAMLPNVSQLNAFASASDSPPDIDAISKSLRASCRSDVSHTLSECNDTDTHRMSVPLPAPRRQSENMSPPLPRMRQDEMVDDRGQHGLQRTMSLPPDQRRVRYRSPRSPRVARSSLMEGGDVRMRAAVGDTPQRHSLILDDRHNVYEDIHGDDQNTSRSRDDIDTIQLIRKLETDASFRSRIKGLLLDTAPPGAPARSTTPDLLYSAPLGAASSSGDDADSGGQGRRGEGGEPPRAARRHRRTHTAHGGEQYGWTSRDRRPRPAPRKSAMSSSWGGQHVYGHQIYHEARGTPLWEEDHSGDDGGYLEPVACQSLTDLVSAAARGTVDHRPGRGAAVPFSEASFTRVPPRHEKSVSTNGRLLWKVNDFAHKQQLAEAGLQVFYYSAPFLSGPEGYRMCARVYMGTGPNARTHMGLDLELTKGDFDYILRKNPFNLVVQFRLMDQGSHKRHIQRRINPAASHSLGGSHLPWDKNTTPVQCPDFFHLDLAHARESVYIREDSVIIYVEVEPFSVSDIYM